MEKTISIEFDGYWMEVNKGGIHEYSGVYCVYECTFDSSKKTVTLNKLLYIGETADAGGVRGRIANHEKLDEWNRYVRAGNTLCYSSAPVGDTDRERVEAALIFKHQPPVNSEHKDSFDYDATTINTTGENALLTSSFTVRKT
ncbi:MAG: GIY-YIG nuclease family protein [Candidatus Micrarchaeota archaeon]|nr:GIY-YIG nuclease family protein [Candidatus Micrarchaeota archaeon]